MKTALLSLLFLVACGRPEPVCSDDDGGSDAGVLPDAGVPVPVQKSLAACGVAGLYSGLAVVAEVAPADCSMMHGAVGMPSLASVEFSDAGEFSHFPFGGDYNDQLCTVTYAGCSLRVECSRLYAGDPGSPGDGGLVHESWDLSLDPAVGGGLYKITGPKCGATKRWSVSK